MKYYIETKRLILRAITTDDIVDMYELDSNALVHKYLGNKPIKSMQQAAENIDSISIQYNTNGIGRWATIEKESGKFIGWSGLKWVTSTENQRSHFHDVGYRFMPAFWGKGYATEATVAALKYAFETMDLQEVIGTCHQDNKASQRVLEKCGLKLKEQFIYKNEIPCHWLSISKNEWENLNNYETA